MDRRCAAGALLALAACIASTAAAPTASEHTSLDLYNGKSEGCYYNFQHYGEGDRIMTNEPCLNCTCHNRMLMCYLRVCPFTKAIGQDCTVEKRADQCCPIVTCPDVPVDLLTSTSTTSPAEYGGTGVGKVDNYGCTIDGKYFAEGSKVPPTPNKPCEHCYCIRNMTTCVMQECTLHVDGCTPIYHKNVCCPVRYFCDHPEHEMPLLDDMTTTVRPTPGFLLTTMTEEPTTITQTTRECVENDQLYPDGALIKTEKPCVHCYCMKGDIVCVVQECGTPMENEGKNCTSLPPREGQCCPDTYICEGDELTTEINELPIEDITTMQPPRRVSIEGSGYRNEPDGSPFTEIPTLISDVEGSGEEQEPEKLIPHDKVTPEQDIPSEPVYDTISSEGIQLTTQSATRVPLLEETETATTEPDKGLNTVPSGIADEDSSEPSFISKTTLGDEPRATEPSVSEKYLTTSGSIEEKTLESFTAEITTLRDDTKVTEPTYPHEQGTITSKIMESDRTEPSVLATSPEDLSKTTEIPVREDEQVTSRISDEDTFKPFISEATTLDSDANRTTEPAVITEQTTGSYERVSEESSESSIVDKTTRKDYSEVTDLPIAIEKQTVISEIADHDGLEPTTTSPSGISESTESTIISEQELGPHRDVEEDTSKPTFTEKTTIGEIEKVTEPTVASEQNTIPSEFVKESSSEPSTLYEITSEDYVKTSEPTIITEKVTGISDISEEKITEPGMIDRTTIKEIETTEPSIISYDKQNQDEETSTIAPDYKPSSLPDSYAPVEEENVATTEPTFRKEDESNTPIDTSPQQQEDEKLTTTLVDVSKETDVTSEQQQEDEKLTTTLVDLSKETGVTSEYVEHTSVQTVTPSIIKHTSKTTTATVPEQGVDETIEQKETTTESFLELSTFAHITKSDKESATTVASVSDISSSTPASDKLDIPLTTTINPEENEIDEDVSPISSPGRIPGEGDCLLSGITYKNDSAIPSTNKCHSGCRCVSSIVKCDPIICSLPPEYMENCQLTYDTPNSCCPTYICDHSKETIPPQSHNQMSGTESPLPSTSNECNGDLCEVSEDKQPPTVPFETSSIEPDEKPEISECDSESCRTDSQTPKHPTQEHEKCTDDKCTPIEDSCAEGKCQEPAVTGQTEIIPPKEDKVSEFSTPICEGESCAGTKDQICDKEGGCEASVDKKCEGDACELKPDIAPMDKPKIPETALPPCEGESCTTAEEEPCTKEGGCEILVEKPCEGEHCEGKEQISPAKDVPQHCDNDGDCKMGEIPEPAVSPCEGENCESKTEVIPSMDELSQICENTDDCREIKVPRTTAPPCDGENCVSKTELPLSMDELPQICENTDDCKEIKIPDTTAPACAGNKCEHKPEIVPTKDIPQICENEEDCKQIKIPETAVLPCEGDSCTSTDIISRPQISQEEEICSEENGCKKPEVSVTDCTEDNCRRTQISHNGEKVPSKCTGSECLQKESMSPTQETTDDVIVVTESPNEKQTSYVSEPAMTEQGESEKGTELPASVVNNEQNGPTELPDLHVTENEDTITRLPEQMETEKEDNLSELPDSETPSTDKIQTDTKTEDISTKAPETITYQPAPDSTVNEEKMPEMSTQETALATELPEAHVTGIIMHDSSKPVENTVTEIQIHTTEQPILANEKVSPEKETIESTDEQNVPTESPQVNEPHEISTERPEMYVTEREIISTSVSQFEEEQDKLQTESPESHITSIDEGSGVPEVSADEQEERTTLAPKISETESEVSELPEIKPEILQSTQSPIEKTEYETSTETHLSEPDVSTKESTSETEAPVSSEVSQEPEKIEDESSTEIPLAEPDVSTKEDKSGTETPVSTEFSQEPGKTEDETSTETHLSEPDVSTKEDESGTETPVSSGVPQEPEKTEVETSTETHLSEPEVSTKEDKSGTETPISSEVSQEPEIYRTTENTNIQEITTRTSLPAVPDLQDDNGLQEVSEIPTKEEEINTESPIDRVTEAEKQFTDFSDESSYDQKTTKAPELNTSEQETETSTKTIDVSKTDEAFMTPETVEAEEKDIYTESPNAGATLLEEYDTKTTVHVPTEHEPQSEANITEPQEPRPIEPDLNVQPETKTELPFSPTASSEQITTVTVTSEEKIVTESPLSLVTKAQQPDATTSQQASISELDEAKTGITTIYPETQVSEEETKTDKPESHITEPHKTVTVAPEQHDTEQEMITKTPDLSTEEAQRTETPRVTEVDKTHSESLPPLDTDLGVTEPETEYPEKGTEKDSSVTEQLEKRTEAPAPVEHLVTQLPEISTIQPQKMETDAEPEFVQPHGESSTAIPVPIFTEQNEIDTIVTETHTVQEQTVTEEYETGTKTPGQAGEEEEIKPGVQENIPSEEEVTTAPELSPPEETYPEKSEPTEKPKPDEKVPEENEILSEIPGHTEKTISIETIPESVHEPENITQTPEAYVDQELITEAPEEFGNKEHEIVTELTELHVTPEKEITDAQEIDVTESPVLLVTKQDESTIIPVSLDVETQQVTTESSIREQELETRAPEELSTKPQEFEIKTEEPFVKVTKSPEIPSSQEDMLTELPVQKETIQAEAVTPEEEGLGTTPSKAQEDIQTQSPVSLSTGPESIDIRQPELAVTEHEDINKGEESSTDSTGNVPIESPKSTESVIEISTKSTLDSEETSELQYEYSETTPYFVELEHHTHKIIEETSTVLTSEELTTARTEPQETKHEEPISEGTTEIPVGVEKQTQSPEVETEKPGDEKEAILPVQEEQYGPEEQQTALIPEDAEKITEPSVETVGETTSETTSPSTDQRFSTESEKDISATSKPPLEGNEQITVPVSSDTEKPLTSDEETPLQSEKEMISSTTRPSEHDVSYETTALEEEFIPAVTTKATTAKVEEQVTTLPPIFDKFTKPEQKPSETFPSTPRPEIPKPGFDELQPTDEVPSPEDDGQLPPSGGYGQEPDYAEEDQAFGPGTCRYGGKVYVSAQQIPRDDPCDFCFCFRSDIICLQQSCPPPIHGCHEEPIQGFCCPRYECPVSMATSLNVTTTTTTTTTTLPPHFLPHAYKGAAQRRGCQIKGHTYKVGEVVRASSGPCLHCTCGGDGQMKCDPKACTPEPMLRQMIAAAVSAKRRR